MPTVDTVPPAADPLGLLKWLFIRTIAPTPAALKSSFEASVAQPITRRFKEFVVAIVLIANRPSDIPVVSEPVIHVEKLALAKTAARAVALLVHVASVAIKNNCEGSSATKAFIGLLLSAPDPGHVLLHVGFPVVLETYSQPMNAPRTPTVPPAALAVTPI
jgi:hypothetical protein